MKQIIQIKRIETRTIELEVPQPLTIETLQRLTNERLRLLGAPEFGQTTAHRLTEWTVAKATPEAELAKARRTPRRGK